MTGRIAQPRPGLPGEFKKIELSTEETMSKEPEKPEIKKPEEIADAPLPEETLNEAVGGACNGTHIKKVTIEM